MARNDSAVQDSEQAAQTEGEATENATPAADAKPKDRAPLMVSLPIELHKILTERAKASNVAVSAMARNVLAREVGFEIPADFGTRAPRAKYASKEDRDQAQKQRYETAKLLMAAFNSGKIPTEILEAMKAAQAGKAEAATS